MSLKTILTAITACMGALGLAGALALGILTTKLHDATLALDASLEAVHTAEELDLHLVSYEAIKSGKLPGDLEKVSELIENNHDVVVDRMRVANVAGAGRVQQLDTELQGYFAGRETVDGPLLSIRALIASCEVRAGRARRDAASWNELADVVGMANASVLLGVTVALILWLRRAFLPVLAIGDAMKSFGDGRHHVRAKEAGPRELRHIAQCFNAMATSLADQAERESTFVAGVAHDLRNPIGTLKIAAHQLGSQAGPLSSEASARILAILTRQADHLDRMVGDLLDRARIAAGALELRLEPQDVRDVIRHAVAARQASTTSHRLELILSDDELVVACDSTRLEQVLDNLLSNAIKYSPAGTTVEVAAKQLDAAAVVVSVTDHGVGIKPDDRRLVFAPFQRVGVLRERVAGIGLGLSNVQKIVEAHGGLIEVESELGRGSVFRVQLPCAPPLLRSATSGRYVSVL